MAQKSPSNVKVICDYIFAEQNEINIKESTKEGKIKCLVRLLRYLRYKPFENISKQDILDYLTSLKKPEDLDPQHKSIGTYNSRQMILLKFFRWLYNPNESATRRLTPDCMIGIKRLPRMEKSAYKTSDLWTEDEHEVFLRYCPSIRDKLYHTMAYDTSARPNELLALHIRDIFFLNIWTTNETSALLVDFVEYKKTIILSIVLQYGQLKMRFYCLQ